MCRKIARISNYNGEIYSEIFKKRNGTRGQLSPEKDLKYCELSAEVPY